MNASHRYIDTYIKAVGVGFEPTVRETRTPVFKTGPFDHSGTPPGDRVLVAGGIVTGQRGSFSPRGTRLARLMAAPITRKAKDPMTASTPQPNIVSGVRSEPVLRDL
jgi:hypothetical protein